MAYRVLIAQFMHETNTFSKLKTTLDDYRRRYLIEGGAIVPQFKGTRNELGGYIDSAAKYGWEPVYGAGVGVHFGSFGVRLEYEQFSAEPFDTFDADSGTVTLGATWTFL